MVEPLGGGDVRADPKTYVLVHGGGHGGWCYKPLARLLRSSGHEVYTPTLTGLGERSHLLYPDLDLDTHITDVVNVLHYEDLRGVILLGHSYGGMVITGVADRAAERVGHLVYLDAANPKNGQSNASLAPYWMNALRNRSRIVNGVELVAFPGDVLPGTPTETGPPHYGVTDPVATAWMDERLTAHPWRCFEQPLRLTNEENLRAIPQTQIVCTSSLATRDPDFVQAARATGRFWDIDTGHDLMLTEPEAVAKILLDIAILTG